MNLTKSQYMAINTLDRNVLVAAAAGSGKTSVLTARILGMITDAANPTPVDRMLVLTFANAAAAEVRSRLRKALSERLSERPTDGNLRLQSSLLNRAHISTIHTFAMYVVRRYFYLTDADPHFKIADSTEIDLLKRAIVDELLEDEYAAPGNGAFLSFVDCYGGTKADDGRISEHILDLHAFAMNIPFYEKWLEEAADMYDVPNSGALADTPWYRAVISDLRQSLNAAYSSLGQAMRLASLPGGPEHYIPALEADRRLLDGLTQALRLPPGDAFAAFADIQFERLSAKKPPCDPALKQLTRDIREKHFKPVIRDAAKSAFPKHPDALAADLAALAPHIRTLCRLALSFAIRFNAAKRRQNVLDFSDLEHLCLGILVDPETRASTAAAAELRAQFDHIMIDEYQDSNMVQEMILRAVARDANRFMVGDVKQSIYRFRSADPSIFQEKYNTYGHSSDGTDIRIDLNENFRSRPEILEAANLVFRQIMSVPSCGIDYDDSAALKLPDEHAAEVSPDPNPYQCEILIGVRGGADPGEQPNYSDDADDEAPEDLGGASLEAEIVAARILRLVSPAESLAVYDKDLHDKGLPPMRPASFGDIVILMRSTKSADAFAQVFARKGIPLDTGGFGGAGAVSLFDTLEVATLISFLDILDNPRQDIPLVSVLSSPIYNLSPDELLEIRATLPRADFYECLSAYVHGDDEPFAKPPALVAKLRAFLDELNGLREAAPHTPISALITQICEQTDYGNIVSAMPMGGLRAANLRMFRERAAAFESSRAQGLFHFMRFIEDVRESGQRIPAAQDAEGSGCVRLMSVHKSKGLEFPIVFVCSTARRFNIDDYKGDLLFHKDLGIGAKLVDAAKRTRSLTLSHSAIQSRSRAESIAEEMRMLYVAMTRAREKLIITGYVNGEASLAKHAAVCLSDGIALDASAVLGASSMLDWLMMSLARHRLGAVFRTPDIEPSCPYIYTYPADFAARTLTTNDLAQLESVQDTEAEKRLETLRHPIQHASEHSCDPLGIEQALNWKYPHSDSAQIPSKLSITEIKRIYQAQMQDSYAAPFSFERTTYRRPDFLAQKKGLSPTEIGTIIHTVMEHLDLHAIHEESHIHDLLGRLVSHSILAPDEAPVVPVKLIAAFVKSPLAMRMRSAAVLRKEVPFVLALNADEIYRDLETGANTRPLLVHGMIDAYFIEGGQAVIVDYKSDYVGAAATPEQLRAKYSVQMDVYRKAVERASGLPVKECILYMLRARKEIKI
ncbi:MAG: helicase-exonuclease AddAB subunit AddA [Defluviitaleaceae bacterium]|nr:helicase-exonuclease AddAB subunit AddA [Defluviitaleaceae bacterium]